MASRAPAAPAATAAVPTVVTGWPFVPSVSGEFTVERVLEEYVGLMAVRRLVFAGERCPTLAVSAFRETLRALKTATPLTAFSLSGGNTIATSATQKLGPSAQTYADVVSRARELLLTPSQQPEHQFFLSAGQTAQVASDPIFQYDQAWHAKEARAFQEQQAQLENQLLIQKRDGEREQVKVATLNLAEFYLNRGDLNLALNKYLESKEFVAPTPSPATNLELLNIALNIIKCSVLLLNMSHVKTQVQRAQRLIKDVAAASAAAAASSSSAAPAPGTNLTERDVKIVNAKLNAAMGLFHMKGNSYHSAAQSFVAVTSDIEGAYSDVVSARDIAAYGSICALAAFSRRELKEQVLNNTEFKKLLELAPNTWKPIVHQFYNSNYAKVFELLEGVKNDLYLDVFLSSHVNRLLRQIRERAFIQYFKAYASVELKVMSVAFNQDLPTLERTVAELIQEGKISARIDMHKKILYARHADQRNDTFVQAMRLGDRYVRDVRAALLRLSLAEAEVMIKGPDSKRKGRTAGERGAMGGEEEFAMQRMMHEHAMRESMQASMQAQLAAQRGR